MAAWEGDGREGGRARVFLSVSLPLFPLSLFCCCRRACAIPMAVCALARSSTVGAAPTSTLRAPGVQVRRSTATRKWCAWLGHLSLVDGKRMGEGKGRDTSGASATQALTAVENR